MTLSIDLPLNKVNNNIKLFVLSVQLPVLAWQTYPMVRYPIIVLPMMQADML